MPSQKITLIISLVVVCVAAWMLRYEVVGVSAGGQGQHSIA